MTVTPSTAGRPALPSSVTVPLTVTLVGATSTSRPRYAVPPLERITQRHDVRLGRGGWFHKRIVGALVQTHSDRRGDPFSSDGLGRAQSCGLRCAGGATASSSAAAPPGSSSSGSRHQRCARNPAVNSKRKNEWIYPDRGNRSRNGQKLDGSCFYWRHEKN